jgi:putative oxidoreductase
MAVAAFVAHDGDPFKQKELALLYLVVSVALIFTGPGKYAIDKK